MTWGDLRAVVEHAPPASAIAAATSEDWAKWTGPPAFAQLLHSIEYSLRWLAWAQSKDAQRRRNEPKPEPAPWVAPERDVKKFGGEAVSWDEMTEWLGW